MKILSSGRDGDIYELSRDLVLRKTRDGRSIAGEVRIMRYAEEQGFPVPHIEEVRAGGTEIVMERIDGPSMLDTMVPPWKLSACLATLADLHDRLHAIEGPDWLPGMPGERGDRLLHLDLHPLNVLMSRTRGPVVIDWPNARRGDPMSDVALTFAIITCARIPVPRPIAVALSSVRAPVVRHAFARRYLGPHFYRCVDEMAILKCFDRNMEPDEIAALEKLARRAADRAGNEEKAPG
jgi:aminoglycoside phosphotransferase (APT) family kinase protein